MVNISHQDFVQRSVKLIFLLIATSVFWIMAALQFSVVVVVLPFLSFTSSAPSPSFFGHKHKHVVIHVPYKVHTIHHHRIEKVPIYKHIPIYKPYPVYREVKVPVVHEVQVPVVKEVHVPVHVHEPEYKGWSSSDWW